MQSIERLHQHLGPLKEVGLVIGETRPLNFAFSVKPELNDDVPVWEYVITPLNRGIVVAQIQSASSFSSLLKRELEFSVISKLANIGVEELKHLREARVIAYIEDLEEFLNDKAVEVTYRPRYAVHPTSPVFLAPDLLLERLYIGRGKTIYVGNLVTRQNVRVHFSMRGFVRHVAIIAQTGAGKSYLAGVLIEELLKQGATIIVLDPHADHVKLTIPNNRWSETLANKVKVFSALKEHKRYGDVRNLKHIFVRLNDLEPDELFYVAGIHESYVQIRGVVLDAMKMLRDKKIEVTIESLLKELENRLKTQDLKGRDRETVGRAINYLRKLEGLIVFSDRTTLVMEELLKPQQVSIIDLSDITDKEADFIAYLILKKLIEVKVEGKPYLYPFPVFIIVEEIHRFAPRESETLSLPLLKRIAAEGRKFGLFLVAISQRPFKVHPDVLSQCNSQIIMRITNPVDQKAVLDASERLSEYLFEDLPGLNRGEAIVVGEIVSLPTIIKVKPRATLEGGADIDVDGLLDVALKMVEEEERERRQANEDWRKFREQSEPK